MLEFKTIEELKPNPKLLELIITFTILEYKVNEISNKPFYIKECKEKYNLKEIETFLRNL